MGRGTRAAYALQVGLALALAVAAAVLATEVAGWWYVRADLSAAGRNTVDPATLERLDHLEGELEVHTFLRPLERPYDALSAAALRRVVDFLFQVENARRGKVAIVHHDLYDLAAAQESQRELGVAGENVVVLRHGDRKTAFGVFGEAVAVDWGNPSLDGIQYLTERGIPNAVDPRTWKAGVFEPARITGSAVEGVFAAAVARVSAADRPLACFSTGHGEPPAEGTLPGSASALARELAADGFEVRAWDPEQGGVPAGCAVLAVLGPRQPLAGPALERVRAYLDGGGRAVVTLGEEAPEALSELCAGYGLSIAPGIVCETVRSETGAELEGLPECAQLSIGARGMAEGHPVTDLMRRSGLRLALAYSASFDRGAVPGGGRILDLVRASPDAWRDLRDPRPPHNGRYDFALDPGGGERVGPATLVALVERPAAGAGGSAPRELRLLAAGSTAFLLDQNFAKNRAFLRAAFNWMAERDERVDVAPRADDTTAIDVARGRELSILSYTLGLALPCASVLAGVLVGWRRRR